MTKLGVVVMAYGTPASADEVVPYYTHIRRGRPPTDEQVADLRARYDAIGGLSPLRAITEAQRAAIAAALPDDVDVVLGYKHASPFLEEAVEVLASDGVERLVGVVLAPHDSRGSVGEYVERLEKAAAPHGIDARAVRSWHHLDEWRQFQARAIESELRSMPDRTEVVFTAHSLPERVLAGDVYDDELSASADAIASLVGLDETRWSRAWQSAGRTPEPWLGPDILFVIDELAAAGRAGVLVCACGFVADHLEILYDLDVQAAAQAGAQGLAFARTAMVNDDATVLAALAHDVARCAS